MAWQTLNLDVEFDGIPCRIRQQITVQVSKSDLPYYRALSWARITDRIVFVALNASIRSGKERFGYYSKPRVALAEGSCAKLSSVPEDCTACCRALPLNDGRTQLQLLEIHR